MYTSNYQLAMARQRDFLAEGARERRARQAAEATTAARPPATGRSRRIRLVQLLRPQAQT
jgi:hypothetical protein